VLLAAGFPALFEHHSEEDVTASMLVAGENDDGGGGGDDGVQLPTSITVPRLWVFGAPTLLEGFLHHAMLHPCVSLQGTCCVRVRVRGCVCACRVRVVCRVALTLEL
jgi:hypothetical protein